MSESLRMLKLLRGISIPTFIKGINQGLDTEQVNLFCAFSAQNCDISDGSLRRCKGSTLYGNALFSTPINSLMKYYQGTISTILAVDNGILYKYLGTSLGFIMGGLLQNNFDYVNYQIGLTEIIIFTNALDGAYYYDGTTVKKVLNRYKRINQNKPEIYTDQNGVIYVNESSVATYLIGVVLRTTVYGVNYVDRSSVATFINANTMEYVDGNNVAHIDESTITTYAPKCSLICLHTNRIWMAGEIENPNRIYYSKILDPFDFCSPVDEVEGDHHGGLIELTTYDGTSIIGLQSLFDDVVIFKNKSVHKIFGSYPGNFTMTTLFACVNGEIVDKTIQSLDNRVYWLATEGIYLFDGVNVKNLKNAIKNDFETINASAIKNSVAIIYKNKYIIAVPTGSNIYNDMIIEYDLLLGNFMIKRGLIINDLIELNGMILYAGNDGRIYNYDIGDTFNGAWINTYWESGITNFQLDNRKKFVTKIHLKAKGNGTIRFTVFTEKGSKHRDINLSSEEKIYHIRLPINGYYLGYRIENLNGCDFTVKQPQMQFNFEQ